jgi:AcrR family transcriptional regulator
MSTREQMMIVGERLIAERGIAGVSLREVQAASGQRNKSAAQYHFGSKAGLVEAIFEHRFAPINEAITDRLAELEKGADPPDIRSLVAAIVEPLAEGLSQDDQTWYARFLCRVQTDFDSETQRLDMPGAQAVLRRISPLLEKMPRALRRERLELFLTVIVGALAAREQAIQSGFSGPSSIPLLRGDLVDVGVAVLEAPVSPATAAEIRTRHSPRLRNRRGEKRKVPTVSAP